MLACVHGCPRLWWMGEFLKRRDVGGKQKRKAGGFT